MMNKCDSLRPTISYIIKLQSGLKIQDQTNQYADIVMIVVFLTIFFFSWLSPPSLPRQDMNGLL